MNRRLNDQLLIMDAILVAKQQLEEAMKTGNFIQQGTASLQLTNLYALLDVKRLKTLVKENNHRQRGAA